MSNIYIIILKWCGYIWLTIAFLLILTGIFGVWMEEGFSGVQRLMSPFNISNWVVILITLAPGLGAVAIADKLSKK